MKDSQTQASHHLYGVFTEDLSQGLGFLSASQSEFAAARGFEAKAGSLLILPAEEAAQQIAIFGLGSRLSFSPYVFRGLGPQLKNGTWNLHLPDGIDRDAVHLAYRLGQYRFDRYKRDAGGAQAVILDEALTPEAEARIALAVSAHDLARDLVNIPANDLGPQELADAAKAVADAHQAKCDIIKGDDLLAQNYPAIHAVGRAAAPHRAPRFVEISWSHPEATADSAHIVLVGKGVVFDTGGLNLKGGAGMGLMKKDMGGAAHALSLGQWIMASNQKVRLTILLAVVENAVAGDAMRPGDILSTRAGLTVEVGNTDAEGRLILADALTRASELSPTITLDFATLTGAARIALGPEVVPFYTDDAALAEALAQQARAQHDPLWPMPLWSGYEPALESDIADLRNDPAGWAQGGSVLAALFLKRFAPKTGAWVHFDLYAWNPRARSGYPVGAEAQTLRACYQFLKGFA